MAYPIGPTKVGHTLRSDIKAQVKRLGKRLNMAEREVSRAVAEALGEVAFDILEDSNRACPIDTGQLRNSAKAFLSRQGRRDLHEIYRIAGASSKDPTSGDVTGIGPQVPQLSQEWNLFVSYSRYNSRGEDIAVWTHEDLNPYGGGSPAAKQPGTGPKYLENSFNQHAGRIESLIGNRMIAGLKKITTGFRP